MKIIFTVRLEDNDNVDEAKVLAILKGLDPKPGNVDSYGNRWVTVNGHADINALMAIVGQISNGDITDVPL